MSLSARIVEPAAQPTLKLRSPSLVHADPIPHRYRALSDGISPPMGWSGLPPATRTLVMTMINPDAARQRRTHWLVYNIQADHDGLPEGLPHRGELPGGMQQGVNDFGWTGWHGPNPRPGTAARYRFVLYALDTPLPLGPGARPAEVLHAGRGHVLAEDALAVTATTPLFRVR
ncbi:MAG: YbhB/YbcL family Raf kinase inhibitor-like protein [Myxococcales bacterium]|jgi:Raf kinase inhibitor-like YbhB/YbcL family protein